MNLNLSDNPSDREPAPRPALECKGWNWHLPWTSESTFVKDSAGAIVVDCLQPYDSTGAARDRAKLIAAAVNDFAGPGPSS